MEEWSKVFPQDRMPNKEQIANYVNNTYYDSLCEWIEKTYDVQPSITYSRCAMQPGWNVKYKKHSKAICTLYPNKGQITCLIAIAERKQMEIEAILASMDKAVQDKYHQTRNFNGSKWLVIDITSSSILKDIQIMIEHKIQD